MTTVTTEIRFFFNGLKVGKGPLHRAFIWKNKEDGSITFSARGYGPFPQAIGDAFKVKNATDLMTDYFDNDTFTVPSSHPLFPAALAAFEAREAKHAQNAARRAAKVNEVHAADEEQRNHARIVARMLGTDKVPS